MKFVDAHDGQPVVGANVLFHATAYQGTITGHGGARASLFLVEAVTNDTGEVSLQAQDFSRYPFIFNTNYKNPSMIVFKPGYVLVILENYRRTFAELEDVTNWMYNGETIKMQRATTHKDTVHAVRWAATFASEAYEVENTSACLWKKIPRFLAAADRAVDEWNRVRQSISDEDLWREIVSSPLQSLLVNEKFYTEKGCGSPKNFFQPYLLPDPWPDERGVK
jgi:hypothetical protein